MCYVRGALSANVIKTAEVCFLSAAQDVMKDYFDNMVFETNSRLKNDFTYNILHKCTSRPMKTTFIKILMLIYTAAQKLDTFLMLIRSRMRQLFMFYGPSALLLTYLFHGVELELQFLNHISLLTKLLNSWHFLT